MKVRAGGEDAEYTRRALGCAESVPVLSGLGSVPFCYTGLRI